MKPGLEQLLGKTIQAIVLNEQRGRLFLVFSDHTHFEFYPGANRVNWARAVDRGDVEWLREHAHGDELIVIQDET
jgi:hypothetical protein